MGTSSLTLVQWIVLIGEIVGGVTLLGLITVVGLSFMRGAARWNHRVEDAPNDSSAEGVELAAMIRDVEVKPEILEYPMCAHSDELPIELRARNSADVSSMAIPVVVRGVA